MRIIKKTKLEGKFEAYDITVPGTHNFALSNGVVVHNCCGHDLQQVLNEGFNGVRGRVNSRPPKHFREALGQMANYLGILQSEWAGAQAFSSFDTLLAPYVFRDKLSYKEVKKAIRSFVYNLNVPSRWGQCVPDTYKCLASDGKWKGPNELEQGELIITVDTVNGGLSYSQVQAIHKYPAPEVMHEYFGDRLNFLVTPGHRILYRDMDGFRDGKLLSSEIILAEGNPVRIPKTYWGHSSGVFHDRIPLRFKGDSDSLYKMAAMIYRDGSISLSGTLKFYNTKGECSELFTDTAEELGVDYSFDGSSYFIRKDSEANEEVINSVIDFIHNVQPFYFDVHKAWLVLRVFHLLDGSPKITNDLKSVYYAADEKMLNAIATLGVIVGWSVEVDKKNLRVLMGEGGSAEKVKVREVKNENVECVWCPTTTYGTFVCMNDAGQVFLTGNCPFTNITLDWTVPNLLKENFPTCGDMHIFSDIESDPELEKEAENRGTELHLMTYKDFVPEMKMIQRAYFEVMTEGDSTGQPFTFPIPTVNITEEFDWDDENCKYLFDNAAKIGSPYFQNFIGSQYKRNPETGELDERDPNAYNPDDLRSMCPLTRDTLVLVRSNKGAYWSSVGDIYIRSSKGSKYECFYNGTWVNCKGIKAGKQYVNEIKLANNRVYKMGDYHLQPVLRDNNLITISAKYIKLGDLIPFNNMEVESGGPDSSYSLGYAVGAYLGDGSKNDTGITYSLCAFEKDDETQRILEEFWSSLGFNVTVTVTKNNVRFVKIGAGSYDVISRFVHNGTALTKGIKHDIVSQSVEMRRGIIAGYIATDGSREKSRIYTSSPRMVDDLIMLFNSVGMKAYKAFTDNRTCRLGSNPNYMVSYIKERENRKGKYKTVDGQLYWYVTEVNRTNELQDMYCLQTDSEPHLFTLADGLITHNCRLQLNKAEIRESIKKRGGGLFGSDSKTGSIGNVTINLARLGYLYKGDEQGLLNRLDELMDLAKESLESKRKFILEMMERGLYPYTSRYIHSLDTFFSTIGINGANEMIRNFTNDKHNIVDDYGQAMAMRLLTHIRERMEMYKTTTGNLWNLEASPGEAACHKFAREDAKRFPDIIQAGTPKNNYYTNSTQLPVSYTNDPFAALEKQDDLQCMYTGGCVEAGNYVVTDRGRILIDELCNNKDLYNGIRVISYNKDTNTSEWDLVTEFHKIDVSSHDKIHVTGSGGLDIVTSDWHPFFVATKEGVIEKRADELVPGDYLICNRDCMLDNKKRDLDPDLAYVIGFYIGDGSMSLTHDNRGGNNIPKHLVRFHHSNKDRLQKVADILESHGLTKAKPHYCDRRSEKLMCLSTTSKAVGEFLMRYGFTDGPKSHSVRFSEALIKELNEDNAFALLSGLLDTDSYLDPRLDDIEFFTASEQLCLDVSWLASALGLNVSVAEKRDPRYDHPHFRVLFPAKQLYKVENKLMSTRRPTGVNKDKVSHNMELKNKYNMVRVKYVTKEDVSDNVFYDLTTEKNHNYLCGKLHYVFIHNTVLHMYMGEAVSSGDACKSFVKKILTNFRLPYISITPTFSVCPTHGYISGKHEYCPYCDEEIIKEEKQKNCCDHGEA